jgi:hypothetical protein
VTQAIHEHQMIDTAGSPATQRSKAIESSQNASINKALMGAHTKRVRQAH